jgi:hypothetical protein
LRIYVFLLVKQLQMSPQSPQTPQSPAGGFYGLADKPPIPPRGVPPPVSQRQLSFENVQLRQKNFNGNGKFCNA